MVDTNSANEHERRMIRALDRIGISHTDLPHRTDWLHRIHDDDDTYVALKYNDHVSETVVSTLCNSDAVDCHGVHWQESYLAVTFSIDNDVFDLDL